MSDRNRRKRKKFLYKVLVNAIALYITALYLAPGLTFHYDSSLDAVILALAAGLVLALVNTFIRPILIFLSLPFNILTLGLLTIVINAFMLKLTSMVLPMVTLRGFFASLWAAIWVSIIGIIINVVLPAD